ncbi:MAG TPA: hypothetical protein VGR09_02845, partial [Gemmatimonadales bacterium]|nr:hypothetical protein [Gemmatimonadales bacterium]
MHVGPSRKSLTRILLWAAPLTWLGCGGGGGTDIALPSLTITTSTDGVELDADGYGVAVDGGSPQAIGLDATVTVDPLPEGQHTVELSGVAANCSAANNPRTVTVSAGGTTAADFSIACGPSAGTLAVTTTTTGAGSDTDGFSLTVDGVDRGAIGVNAIVSLASVTPGVHSVGLTGLAATCVVAGDNPRGITVTLGQATPVGFTITCAAPPPGSGSVQITATTTGSSLDPDGYSVSLDGGDPQGIGTNGTLTIGSIAAGSHSLQLSGEVANCTVSGDNPRVVTISSGQTATVQFALACVTPPPGSGSVQITTATTGSSLDPDGYAVRLDGGNPQGIGINGTLTIGSVPAGSHSLRLSGEAANCTVSGDNPRAVTIGSGQTATVTFTITCAGSGPSLNLRISNLYITQSTQSLDDSVPLVAGRSGYLRVFVLANQSTGSKPTVEVTLRNGGTVTTRTISAPSSPPPTSVEEGTLGSSWNLPIADSLIQPGLSILAKVDPQNAIAEANENDNTFPALGTPQALTVSTPPPAKIRFIPIQQGEAPPGDVNNGNKDQLVQLARRLYPLNTISTDIHAVYQVAAGQLQSDATGWNQVLSDIEGMRVAEGSDRTYYGVARLDYQVGIVGMGFVGLPSALGTDNPADVKRVTAHELGHTWNQLHTPCANPPNIDPDYPYGTGIGVYGFDVAATSVKPPSTSDIMGYCSDPWISDYIYQRVMNYRA